MNKRIKTIANMVMDGMIVADIGTDHAFLPIFLVQKNKTNKVYACDIAEGPLKQARKNIEQNHMENEIKTIISNGFENVPNDTEIVVIAGMGFYTAKDILEAGKERLHNFKQLIVEVNRDVNKFRKWLSEKEFLILDEEYINENGHDYVAIAWNCQKGKKLNDKEILLGPILMKKRSDEWIKYIEREINKTKKEISFKNENDKTLKDLNNKLSIYKSIL